jgi:carboxymethylenebutenolidase
VRIVGALAPRRYGEVMADTATPEAMEAIFAQHMDAEMGGDLDLTLATMSADPHLVNVPTMVGGAGPEGVREFYAKRLIGQFFPPDVEFTTVSRTCGDGRLVDELIISFTHTTKIDWMLPGVEPTGRPVSVAFVVVVGVEDGKIAYEHIHWDQATVLVQIGLLDPTGLPVVGREATAQLLDPTIRGPHFPGS